jgi:hypothetical protein
MNPVQSWDAYCADELAALKPILSRHGYSLDESQPHLGGERYLMQAVTTASGRKLILLGRYTDGMRVVIKATREPNGIRELRHEQHCREVLTKIDFAGSVFHLPTRLALIETKGFYIIVTEFLENKPTFLERSLKEQFGLALRAFKAQESAHATTFSHRKLIMSIFGMRTGAMYLTMMHSFIENVRATLASESTLISRLADAHALLAVHERTIEQYSGFLTHTDFVPHNIRIKDDTIYLLDHSSLTFGNKYEGWARFLNFMALYNPPLSRALTEYIALNRSPEESVSLRMMRLYRLAEIIWYYTETLEKSDGDLLRLNRARVVFWSDVLASVLADTPLPESIIERYKSTRDSLRSEDEKKRQVGLH